VPAVEARPERPPAALCRLHPLRGAAQVALEFQFSAGIGKQLADHIDFRHVLAHECAVGAKLAPQGFILVLGGGRGGERSMRDKEEMREGQSSGSTRMTRTW
jgi:hypothetical protein